MAVEVNKSEGVRIEKVCQIDRQATKLLLEGETNKRKEYRAYCYSGSDFNSKIGKGHEAFKNTA